MRRKWYFRIPGIVVFVIAAVAFLGAVVQHLWNWLIPSIVGWRAITFLQAVGLLLLSKILFGGFRGRGGMHWRHRMEERWGRMSPEEREKFSRGLRDRCGSRGSRGWQAEEQKV